MKAAPEVRDADAPFGGVRVRASLPLPPERSRLAMAVSALLHLLLILVLIRVTAAVVQPTHSPIGDAFQLALGGGGGGGKGGATFAAAPPLPAVVTPVVSSRVAPVVPQVVPPPLAVEMPMVFRDSTPVSGTPAAAGTGGGSGGGAGTGTGPGTGSGVGPGRGGGTGGGTGGGRGGIPPVNRTTILPPLDPPKSLRGKSFEVTFSIDAGGKVLDIQVNPPILDRGFARKFAEIMRGYDWRPARDSLGKAIAGSLVYTLSF